MTDTDSTKKGAENEMNKDIERAVESFRDNARRYEKADKYYNGDHDLTFATEKFQNAFGSLFREFAMNLCPAIVDACRDKLRLTGFSVEAAVSMHSAQRTMHNSGKLPPRQPPSDAAATPRSGLATHGQCCVGPTTVQGGEHEMARRIWFRNRMGLRSREVHGEALRTGDAYVIVWPDEAGRACLYPNRASQVTVMYDEERPGHIVSAAKWWVDVDKYVRLNLFYADRVEKWVSREKSEGNLPEAAAFRPVSSRFQVPGSKSAEDVQARAPAFPANGPSVIPNPFGVVPVFHFANNSAIGGMGRSELAAAIPIQDGLNKSVLDMLVAMEFSAFRQRWIAGLDIDVDTATGKPVEPYKAGIERLWVAANTDTKFGDFDQADLVQFLKVKDGFRIDMASVTGTPLHYFLQSPGHFPSGESLKKSETRFLAKIRDRQESFGQVWADVMALALRMEGLAGGVGAGLGPDVELITEWEDPSPLSERERLENLLLKRQIGLPVEQALIEAGYGSDDADGMVSISVVPQSTQRGFLPQSSQSPQR